MGRAPDFDARWRDRPDKVELNKLVEENRGLVYLVVRRVCRRDFRVMSHFDDLVQEGFFGLMHAALRFDPMKGGFSTHAYFHILAWVTRGISKLEYVTSGHDRTHGRKRPRPPRECSLDAMLETEDGGDEAYLSFLEDESALAAFENVDTGKDIYSRLDRLKISERDKDILRRLAGSGETLDVIGARYGVSRERIRQLEARLSERLRRILANPSEPDLSVLEGG